MSPRAVLLAAALAAAALPAVAQQTAASAGGAVLRAIDKITGDTTDLSLARGEVKPYGRLRIRLDECRYPADNPTSDAFAHLEIRDIGQADPAFSGWMIASSPALNALDHPRYDVWLLRCNRS